MALFDKMAIFVTWNHKVASVMFTPTSWSYICNRDGEKQNSSQWGAAWRKQQIVLSHAKVKKWHNR